MVPLPDAPPRSRTDPPSAWQQGRERRRRSIRHRQAGVLLALYVGMIGVVTLTPESVDRGVYPQLMRGVRFLQHHHLPWFRYSMIEECANVAMFVPLGLLGVLAFGLRRGGLVIVSGAALSSGVELAQGAFLPHRVASLADVATNTVGGVIGVMLAAAIASGARRRGGSRS